MAAQQDTPPPTARPTLTAVPTPSPAAAPADRGVDPTTTQTLEAGAATEEFEARSTATQIFEAKGILTQSFQTQLTTTQSFDVTGTHTQWLRTISFETANWKQAIRLWFESPGGWLAAGLVLYALVACGLLLLASPDVSAPASLLAHLPPSLLAAGLAWSLSKNYLLTKERQRAWRWIATAHLVYFTANLMSAWFGFTGQPQTPSAADVLYIGFYPLSALGLYWFLRSMRDDPLDRSFWLDAATVALGFGAFLWFFVLRSVASFEPDTALERALVLVYPAADCLLFVLTAMLLLRQPDWRRQPALVWFGAGMCALLAADLLELMRQLEGAGSGGVLPDVLHYVCYALFGIAAHREYLAAKSGDLPRRRTADEVPPFKSFLPFAGLTLAIVTLLFVQVDRLHDPAGIMTLVVCGAIILVLARQAISTDQIAELRAKFALRAAEAKFASLVRNSSDVIAVTEPSGIFRFLTQSAVKVFGAEPEALQGRRLADVVVSEDKARAREFFARTLAEPRSSQTLEVRVRHEDGRTRVVEVLGTNLVDDPAVRGCVLNIRDITDRKGLEDQLKRLAFHDPLTLLANRALFRDRVEHAVAVAKRTHKRMAVIFVDLDNFKKINDSLGHGVGDKVLRASAQRLSKCTRTSDTVARLGGDEFAVLVENADDETMVLEICGRIVEALKQPFAFAGSDMRVAASVGVAFTTDADGVEEVLRNADVAMYHAKAQGKSRYAVFQPQMQQAAHERLRIENDLSRALRKNQFILQYQPIVDLKSGYLLGVEALVRWQHPERGLIPPGEFIGIAEDTGQVLGIGRWVMQQACTEVRAWQERLPLGSQVRVAINVSGKQLASTDLVGEVTRVLQETKLDPGSLVVEMTESVVMQNTEATLAKLQQLKKLGIKIAIDDFGTGYSSLSYLHRFPIDILKIDRSFVQRLGDGRDGAELARAIITLGESLGLEVVAEGVEYDHQARELQELGCVAGQGYYWSKPAPLKEIEYSVHARRRQMVVSTLPEGVDISATGRFQRPQIDALMREMEQKDKLQGSDEPYRLDP